VWNLIDHHLASASRDGRKLVLHLHGPHGVGKRELALHVCWRLNRCLLSIDAETLLSRGTEAESLLRLAFREALLQQAHLLVEHVDALLQDSARPLLKALAVSEYGRLVFLSGSAPWTNDEAFAGASLHSVELPLPEVTVRAAVWERYLAGQAPEAVAWARQLACQFRLTPGQIRAAIELARNHHFSRAEERAMAVADLAAACRSQARHKLRDLAVKIEPRCGWDDIILPADKLAHLREVCNQIRHQYRVFGTWGFGQKLTRGQGCQGLSALFTGPSGTGKTMAAEVLAHELGLDLYKVDLSGVVSKYIGETEKNLSRIFAEAETSNAILFFDEADALFGKRTELSDAHDRYANIETSYLLQKMEACNGTVILATNLRENMDEAFTRRIRFIIDFPFPDETNRRQIWRSHFPPEAPASPEIDYDFLARALQVAGGSIKNIVLNAAFLAAAASDGDPGPLNGCTATIGMREILHSAQREFAKMGKLWNEQHVGGTR
jgi:SpoVK/Ycf46/Vps4 family AAA+-type ATPase